MAQKVKIILEDDLDGGTAGETVRFALDGGQFEIDLSTENAKQLREAIRPYTSAAQKVTTQNRRGAGRTAGGGQQRNKETAQIRAWAKENGYEISDRGRIYKSIQDAYHAAQKAS
ncbi:Lsr2 family protein [Rothia sp. AR01]|uniref:Lsr2 family protein n=1 Tax=Rothia santali TaxID=2949643 RepID=A0A9X2HIR4_9MICC|nr:Lsr2 family protein [Rothia santali]MCP3427262.1 Lsr2 family protein [Rothia santali]